jgi:hypothetical protein
MTRRRLPRVREGAVGGQLGRTDANGFLSQLRFGFKFEPDKLPSVLEYFKTISRM